MGNPGPPTEHKKHYRTLESNRITAVRPMKTNNGRQRWIANSRGWNNKKNSRSHALRGNENFKLRFG
jgi:hypothetical protein